MHLLRLMILVLNPQHCREVVYTRQCGWVLFAITVVVRRKWRRRQTAVEEMPRDKQNKHSRQTNRDGYLAGSGRDCRL
jgi:hypothetical protein